MSKQKEQIIAAFVAKIKQDHLDQRRTVLSEKDQAFVNAVGEIAADWDIELEPSVAAIVEVPSEAEDPENEDLRPPQSATNDELRAYMDEYDIAYESDDNKASLNEKIDEWLAQ